MATIAGILEKLGGGLVSRWQKRFFAPDMDRGELMYYDDTSATDPSKCKGSMPLHHVEIVDRGQMFGKYCFSIMTKEGKKAGKEYFLAAKSSDEKAQWLIELMKLAQQYRRLFEPNGPPGPAEVEAGEPEETEGAANAARIKKSPLYGPCIESNESNQSCADCGAASPTWCVHEPWGVFVCIECIGVHRSLWAGNCREIQLDKWRDEDVEKMKALGGNDRANAELEFHVPDTVVKPTQFSARDVRSKFIVAKYKEQRFDHATCERTDLPRQPAKKRDTATAGGSRGGVTTGPPRYTGVLYVKFQKASNIDLSGCATIIANGFQGVTSAVAAGRFQGDATDISSVETAFPLDSLRRPLFVSFTDSAKEKVFATLVILASVNLREVPEGTEVPATWTPIISNDARNTNGQVAPTITGTVKFETLA